MRLLTLSLAALLALPGNAWAAGCGADDIAKAVDAIGARLRSFNSSTMADLRPKLKQLQAARGWSAEDLAVKTDALVSDPETTAYDMAAYDQFARIDELGSAATVTGEDCARMEAIQAASVALLSTMQAKADHLKAKVAEAQKGEPPPPLKPKASVVTPRPKPPKVADWTTTTALDPDYEAQQQAALKEFKLPDVATADAGLGTYSKEEIQATSSDVFGTLTSSLASVITFAFEKAGRPNGYILGDEAGGAFLAGVRYGEGKLHLKDGSVTKVFWRGPSIGADLGASGSRTMFLVYNLKSKSDVFKLVSGLDGSAFVFGGVGITFLSDGETVLAPIRTGGGLRLGVSAGYLKLTPERNWVPF